MESKGFIATLSLVLVLYPDDQILEHLTVIEKKPKINVISCYLPLPLHICACNICATS